MDTDGCGSLFTESVDFLQQLVPARLHLFSPETEEAEKMESITMTQKVWKKENKPCFLPDGNGEQPSTVKGSC